MNRTAEIYRNCKADYEYNGDVMCKDSDRVRRAKYVTSHRISEQDKVVIRLYAELGSLSKLGNAMGVAKSTIRSQVVRIQRQVQKEMEDCDV